MKIALYVLAAALVLAGCVSSEAVRDSGTHFAADALQPFVDNGELSGAISVFCDGDVQEVACVGCSDVDTGRPIALDDVFMQCSQTKGFCGVTVAMLVEEGKVSLDDPVSKYLPEFANLSLLASDTNGTQVVARAATPVTLRMCMNHTSGLAFELPNVNGMGGWSRRMPLRSVAAVAAGLPLRFEPGTRVQYSNLGIDVGAAVVEVVTGQRWEDFLKARVLDPLGMSASTFWPTDEQLDGRIVLYALNMKATRTARVGSLPAMAPPFNGDRVFASAGAGLWTTARDQLKFYRMLMNLGVGDNGVRILGADTVRSLLAVSTRPSELAASASGYSLGLVPPVTDAEDAWFGPGGAWQTNCLVNWHKRRLKLWVVQQCGGRSPWAEPYARAAEAFFKTRVDSSAVDAYTGRMK